MNHYENLSSEEKLQKIQERFFPYQSLDYLRGLQCFGWDPDDLFRESDLELLTCLKELKEVVIYARKDLSPQGFECLKKLPDLRSIHLYGSDVDDLALESLAEITSLECLVLGRGTLTDNGLKNLRRLSNLQLLSLNDFPNLTLDGIRKILPEMKAIRHFDLPTVLEIEGSTPELKGLEKLHQMKILTCNGPEDHTEIYDAIGQMPHLEELTWMKKSRA